MRASDFSTSAAHIRDAFDELQIAWQEASAHWNDEVSHKFCDTHLEPLAPVVKQSLDAMTRMAILAGAMHNDLES